MSKKKGLSRRKFIVRASLGGTGLIIGTVYFSRHALRRSMIDYIDSGALSSYQGNVSDPQLWFEINKANQVTLYSPKVEMGQGIFTGLAQLAAEELELDLAQIKVIHAPSQSGNVDGGATGGSTSMNSLWQPLRELAATLREMLKLEAAKKLGLEASQLKIEKGIISGGGKSLSYGEIVQGVEKWDLPETPPLKKSQDFKYIGKPVPRIDLEDKVMGRPIFGMDAKMDNMLYGAIVRPSKIGVRYKGANISKALGMPGVIKVVKEKDFVGVVATSRVEAENAKKAIIVEWESGKNWQTKDIEELILVGKGEEYVIQTKGSSKSILEKAQKSKSNGFLEAEYKSPLGSHAQLEPNGALAYVEKDRATVYISTQVIKVTRAEVAKRLGLSEENVHIIPTYLGGGFGRRLHTPNAIQAALLSKAVGKPVKCFFDRKEEFQNDTFRPPTHHVLRATLTKEGKIEAIEHNYSSGNVMYGSPIVPGFLEPILGADAGAMRGGKIQYHKIPNYQAISWKVELPFSTSWWRSLGLLANTFAIESFIDELALKSGQNPVQFRLDHLGSDEEGKKIAQVIKVAAKKANYQDKALNNRAMGIAASIDAGTPVAQVVEVSRQGKRIRVEKVTCVMDCGLVVNPDQVKAQCEGSIIMGLSAAMFEKMYVEDGELKPIIYGSYQMALMRDAPRDIEVVLIEGGDTPMPVGEPPLGPIGAAIANAIFRLTGERLREMPLQLT